MVEADQAKAHLIVDSLLDAGSFDIHVIAEPSGLARQIRTRQPDVVLIDVSNPSRDMLEELALASGPMERPVAMFVDRTDEGMSSAAIEAGVSAYVVDGLQASLISESLKKIENGQQVAVKADTIQTWPARVLAGLFDAAKELNNLGKDEEEDEDQGNG